MAAAGFALQKALFATLNGNAGVLAVLGGARIYVAGAEAAQGFAQEKMPGW